MIAETEGIVLKQTKAANGRRLLELFTKKYGKISVGTSISETGKNKAALAIRPFTYGKYQLYKGRDIYDLNSGQVIKSFYNIGEDIDKYGACAYALELTDKLLPQDMPQPALFNLLISFLGAMEKRSRKYDTMVIAYIVKTLTIMGAKPELDKCSCCGESNKGGFFSIEEGGIICNKCAEEKNKTLTKEKLIFETKFGIVDVLRFCEKEPFRAFEKIAIKEEVSNIILEILRSFLSYHFDVKNLKSEDFFLGQKKNSILMKQIKS